MIDGKILKFGYGDIAVSSSGFWMTFISFKPPVEVGINTRSLFENKDITPVGKRTSILLGSLDDFKELKDKLANVCEQRVFEFKGYTFDFSNFNEKSVEVIEGVRQYMYTNYMFCAAC